MGLLRKGICLPHISHIQGPTSEREGVGDCLGPTQVQRGTGKRRRTGSLRRFRMQKSELPKGPRDPGAGVYPPEEVSAWQEGISGC